MGRHRAPRSGRRGRTAFAVMVLAAVVAVSAAVVGLAGTTDRSCRTTGCTPPAAAADAARDGQTTPPAGSLQLGVTHLQHSLDPGGDPAALASGRAVLASSVVWQVHALMGWGNPNPEPSPGVHDWSGLDRRMRLTKQTHGKPILVLCCAPDWMKGGRAGSTRWSAIDERVTRAHYADFAALAVAAARRYPQVRTFVVWNEMKGFWSSRLGRWDQAAYTDLYNTVYDALKAYDPSLRVGGPYVHLNSFRSPAGPHRSGLHGCWGVADQRDLDAITYWSAHAHGADFVAVDGGTETRRGLLTCDPMAANTKFSAATRWLRSRTHLPVWWMELYPQVRPQRTPAGDPVRAAVFADAVRRLHAAGAAAVFLWGPEQSSLSSAALWTSTAVAGGGRALPLAKEFPLLRKELGSL